MKARRTCTAAIADNSHNMCGWQRHGHRRPLSLTCRLLDATFDARSVRINDATVRVGGMAEWRTRPPTPGLVLVTLSGCRDRKAASVSCCFRSTNDDLISYSALESLLASCRHCWPCDISRATSINHLSASVSLTATWLNPPTIMLLVLNIAMHSSLHVFTHLLSSASYFTFKSTSRLFFEAMYSPIVEIFVGQ